jgi:SOS response regulatory protein OraA/RecX
MRRPAPGCYDQAVELLGQRPHFRRQLAQKLARRGYAAEEIERTLDRLAEQGYLDDEQAARGFAAGRLAHDGEGRVRIEAELRRRGAAAGAVEAALAGLPHDELPAARRVAARWLARRGDASEHATRSAASGHGSRAEASKSERTGRSEVSEHARGGEGSEPAPRDLAPLARHLARKGFPAHVIVAVLSEQPGGEAAAAALEGDES